MGLPEQEPLHEEAHAYHYKRPQRSAILGGRFGWGRGAGRVSAANWGIFWGGGGLNIFVFGAEMSTKNRPSGPKF